MPQTAERYHGRVPVMEIINEAHDKANLWHLDHEQILDITKADLRRGPRRARRASSG